MQQNVSDFGSTSKSYHPDAHATMYHAEYFGFSGILSTQAHVALFKTPGQRWYPVTDVTTVVIHQEVAPQMHAIITHDPVLALTDLAACWEARRAR